VKPCRFAPDKKQDRREEDMRFRAIVRSILLGGSLLGAATSAAVAGPDYSLLTTIAIPATPANNQGGKMTAFDISFVDPVTGDYYFADRSNASVDVINGATNTLINQIGGFAGQQATTSTSGPDGVLVAHIGGNAILYGGDAGSTLRVFNVNNPAAATALGTVNTGGTFRVDEMAFSPASNLLMVANNADTPAFATLISTTTQPGTIAHGNITIPGQPATGGMEQSVWDPHTGTFFVSIPVLTNAPNDPGGLAEVDTNGTVVRTISFASLGIASCAPSGLALGGSGNLMVGCSNAGTQTVVVNPVAGTLVSKIAAVSGSDELWYDPVTGNFYVTGVDAAGNRVIDVVNDAALSVLQSIDLTALGADHVNAHSVAVDPFNGNIFVPLEGTTATATDTLCPNGCVAVFAMAAVPEPGSLAVLVVGLAGLMGLALRRRPHG
jgi:hypothetical protein